MAEQSHYEKFVDHIVGDDDSELGKTRAERDYALHCLEREIAICARTQVQNDALVKALEEIIKIMKYPDPPKTPNGMEWRLKGGIEEIRWLLMQRQGDAVPRVDEALYICDALLSNYGDWSLPPADGGKP